MPIQSVMAASTQTTDDPILESLRQRIAERGDLPIIRDNGAKILRASENTDAGARDVARLILQDPGFAAKVLKVANSAYFNRGNDRIGTISRAVVILGMDMVRQISLGLGFVEMFEREHPGVDMRRIVANSFAAAVTGQEMARALDHPHPEETFVAALLNNLGTIALGYYMPGRYVDTRARLAEDPESDRRETERGLLGMDTFEIGSRLAREWKLPESVPEGIEAPKELLARRASGKSEQLAALACLSNRITENLFGPRPTAREWDLCISRVETSLNIKGPRVVELVESACERVRRLAQSFEMEPSLFRPLGTRGEEGGTSARSKLVARVNRSIDREEEQRKAAGGQARLEGEGRGRGGGGSQPPGDAEKALRKARRAELQLRYLRDITSHLMSEGGLDQLLRIILEGIHMGIGFDRVLLLLSNPERSRFKARFAMGGDAQDLAERMVLPNDPDDNIFAKAYQERRPRFVESVARLGLRHLIPEFLKSEGRVSQFVLSPIHADEKVIGFFYADKAVHGEEITQAEYDAFLHFALQANIGLDRLSES